jgi:hypothetical protein
LPEGKEKRLIERGTKTMNKISEAEGASYTLAVAAPEGGTQTILVATRVDMYEVPVDPMDDLQCESCQ